jgi:acylphosphatase
MPDGSVEAVFEGEKKKVEELIGWCHRGPAGAKVSQVKIIWEPFRNEYGQFSIRYGS